MQSVALLFVGFSLGAALLLILGNILQRREPLQLAARLAGFVLILSLSGIQSLHLGWLLRLFDGVHSGVYIALLYCVAPSFYLYSRQLLSVDTGYRWRDGGHALPLMACTALPYSLALPGAFVVGSLYLLWLAHKVYLLRAQRQRFRLELLALATLFAIALAVLSLGFVWPLLDEAVFFSGYSVLIGMAFFAVTLTLLRFPNLPSDVAEAVQAAYSASTLKNVDKPALLSKLDDLMRRDKLYAMEDLNLALLAEQLNLSPHQLSELINTEFQRGFSRYVREHRIDAAKKLLLAEPEASVLSIGLTVGFSTQSNFYAAFREIAGMAPGQYRKLHS